MDAPDAGRDDDASTSEFLKNRLADLCDRFREADARMRDLPVYNPALVVDAVGFRKWAGHGLAVIITPWFMNVMMIPGDRMAWREHAPGDKVSWTFPAGRIQFIVGVDAICGSYQSCSLFSPVLEFATPEAARLAAEAALATLMHPEVEADKSEIPDFNRRRFLRGQLTEPTSP